MSSQCDLGDSGSDGNIRPVCCFPSLPRAPGAIPVGGASGQMVNRESSLWFLPSPIAPTVQHVHWSSAACSALGSPASPLRCVAGGPLPSWIVSVVGHISTEMRDGQTPAFLDCKCRRSLGCDCCHHCATREISTILPYFTDTVSSEF